MKQSPLLAHRLMEGVLLRLGRLADASGFVMRGGMLLRHWFRPLPRWAGDLDLVATFPFDIEQTAQRFRPVLADQAVSDGVRFDADLFRAQGICVHTAFPGVRLFVAGKVARREEIISIDVTFGEPLVPAPVQAEYLAECSGQRAALWMCRPETIVGRKLHALWHMGRSHWRPKDLNDLRLLLQRVPVDEQELPEAITASFASRGDSSEQARAVLGLTSWWQSKAALARWQQFARAAKALEVPTNLAAVVADLHSRLAPILERLP